MGSLLVSVIIPARNAENTIENAIVSVLEQTMPNLEIIVVDDASTDGTAAVVSTIKDPRLRLLRVERNVREAAARNLGLRNAQGKWAAFLDADDEWAPERLERLLQATEGKEECFVADIEVLAVPGPSGRLMQAGKARQPEDGTMLVLDFEGFLKVTYDVRVMVPLSVFFKYGILFPEWGSGGEWIFVLSQLLAHGVEGRMVRYAGYLYRAAATHDCSTLVAREEHLRVLEFLANDPLLPSASKELLLSGLPDTYERLVAAALKERKLKKFFHYACRHPRALGRLPRRALFFVFAKARIVLAKLAVARRKSAGDPEPVGAVEGREA